MSQVPVDPNHPSFHCRECKIGDHGYCERRKAPLCLCRKELKHRGKLLRKKKGGKP